MTVDVILAAGDATYDRVMHKSVAVIDVFRATSVIVEALHNGARAIIPVVNVEEAVLMRQKFGEDEALLGGERDTVMIEGFDLDNSPLMYKPETVRGKTIIFTTTNGTRAIQNSRGASSIMVASFLNMSAVCDALARMNRDVALVCSGREDRFTAEDGLCAGAMVGTLVLNYGFEMSDIAEVLQQMYANAASDLRKRLETTTHYKDINARGYDADIRFCLQRDIYDVVPVYDNKRDEVTL